jgi:hypothetical protein
MRREHTTAITPATNVNAASRSEGHRSRAAILAGIFVGKPARTRVTEESAKSSKTCGRAAIASWRYINRQ